VVQKCSSKNVNMTLHVMGNVLIWWTVWPLDLEREFDDLRYQLGCNTYTYLYFIFYFLFLNVARFFGWFWPTTWDILRRYWNSTYKGCVSGVYR
jgi:hypothetical protein